MKKTLFYFLTTCTFLVSLNLYSVPVSISPQGAKSGSSANVKKFKRIYNHTNVNRNNINLSKTDDIIITFEDFTNHFAFGKSRTLTGTDTDVIMNIGAINSGIKETWTIPDFSSAKDFITDIQHQVPANELDIFTVFGTGTHGIYSDEVLERDDLYDLQPDKLTFVGFEEVINGGDYNNNNDWREYQYNQLKAPIPLQIGIEYSSIAKFEEIGNPLNYVEYTDIYNVIGQGTLKTLDDGDSDAVKAIYKEETRQFVNGVETSFSERYEIIFYSKKGHYVFAGIENPWSSEGKVVLKGIRYSKLNKKTASISENNISKVKSYPNPIKKGETLQIETKISLHSSKIDLYNIAGQKITTLKFNQSNNNKYQTKIPENLANGLYFYKIYNTKGNVVKNGKIQIQ